MLAKYTRFLKHFLRQITRLLKICCCFQGLNFRLAFAIAAGAFGSAWQHGYNTGVMNAPQKLIENWINSSSCTPETTPDNEDTVQDGVVECEGTKTEGELKIIIAILVSAFCVGGIIGGSLIGVISSRFGR